MSTLVELWKRIDLKSPPFIFPGDEKYLSEVNSFRNIVSFEKYVDDINEIKKAPHKFHLNLLPIPYMGNLETAKIFILMANPGLAASDYKAEFQDADYPNDLIKNLHQKADSDFPYVSINPKYCWHGGFEYWDAKFKDIIGFIQKEYKLSYVDALSFFSQNVAALELIPYHSKQSNYLPGLESTKLIKNYVTGVLLPRARTGKILIVVTRNIRAWGLKEEKKIILYGKPGQARGASLGKVTKGGKAIMEFLGNIH